MLQRRCGSRAAEESEPALRPLCEGVLAGKAACDVDVLIRSAVEVRGNMQSNCIEKNRYSMWALCVGK